MDIHPRTYRSRSFNIIISIAFLAAASLACTIEKSVFRYFLGHRDEDPAFMDQFGLESDDLVTGDNSESVLEGNESYGSADQGSSEDDGRVPEVVPDPVTNECGEAGYCTAVYPVDIRGTSNPPDVMVYANSAEYASPVGFSVTYPATAGPWYEWIVLREPGDYIQASSPAGYTSLGIQFWGDQTNGWTRVTLDGVEVWRGDTTAYGSDGLNYYVYVEISGVEPGPHTLRAELLGQPGTAGGVHVPVFYFAYRN